MPPEQSAPPPLFQTPLEAAVSAAIDALRAELQAQLGELERRIKSRESLGEEETRKIAELASRLGEVEELQRRLVDQGQRSAEAQTKVMTELLEQSGTLRDIVAEQHNLKGAVNDLAGAAGTAVGAAVSTEFADRDRLKKKRNTVVAIVLAVVSAPTFVPHLFDYLAKAGEFFFTHFVGK